MRKAAGKSSTKPGTALALAACVALALALPSHALGGPATKEYTPKFPNAKGKQQKGEAAADPAALPPSVADQLQRNIKGKALATIATAEELGAPEVVDTDTGGEPSLLSALLSSLLDPIVIGVAVAMVAIVVGARHLRPGH